MSLLKYICLTILSLLVCVLVHVNYLLLQRLGTGDDTSTSFYPEAMKESMMTMIHDKTTAKSTTIIANNHREEDAASQKRLHNLRRKVSNMKTEIHRLKGVLENLKQQRQGEDNDDDEKEGEEEEEYKKGEGDDATEDDRSMSKVGKPSSPTFSRHDQYANKKSYPRLTCTSDVAQKQVSRMNSRFREWWSHSACPDQVWMKDIQQIFETASGGEKEEGNNNEPYLILDIGCNKGYTSADFFDALSPGTNINPHTLVEAIRAVAKDMNTKFDKDGGVCNDSKKPLNEDRTTRRRVQIHCFEPSPATYNMLKLVRSKLMMTKGSNHDNNDGVEWHIHNVGVHDHDGEMSWHSACANAVGDELCTIVPDGTEGAINVPVVTVDKFLSEFETNDGTIPLVHMLKIDAEGLDPAVLAGSTSLLTQSNAIMVVFEFNPGLSEKENPHGMWGKGGNPPRKLLEVTTWLDELGYDCYLDTRLVDERERKKGVPDNAPALYRITGDCLVEEPKVRGWANVVCASRKFGNVASLLRNLATMV